MSSYKTRPIDEPRKIRIIVVGAGASGIIAGIRIRQRLPEAELVIYEKNPVVGGTWFVTYNNIMQCVACINNKIP